MGALIRKILGDGYLSLGLTRLIIEEAADAFTKVHIFANERGHAVEVMGEGVGVVDAMLAALLRRYGAEYPSLKSLKLTGFSVGVALETKQGESGVDAVGTVHVEVANSEGKKFVFEEASRSITTSSARAMLAVVEYFVNSERAFIMLDKARRDAQARNREDLVTRYTAEMAQIVESTSYTEVIDQIRKGLHH